MLSNGANLDSTDKIIVNKLAEYFDSTTGIYARNSMHPNEKYKMVRCMMALIM